MSSSCISSVNAGTSVWAASQARHADGPQRLQTDLGTIGKELESGNIDAARSDFAQMMSAVGDRPGGPDPAGIGKAFDALGAALDSGDVSAAKDAFSKLETALDKLASARPHRPAECMGGYQGAAQGGANEVNDALKTLSKALDAGDVSSAQQAMDSLQSLLRSLGSNSSDESGTTLAWLASASVDVNG